MDVALLDWRDARNVPACLGPFGFDDQIIAIAAAIEAMPSPVHVVGICQSALPVLTAAAAVAARPDRTQIESLTLMGAPFDPSANPTVLSTALQASSRLWLELIEITTVDVRFKGAGRRVYPGAQQLIRVQNYINRHSTPDSPFYRKLRDNDGLDPDRFPFLDSLTTLKDLPADAFLENIDRHYHRSEGSRVALSLYGEAIDPGALRDIAVLTVEGESDDIVAPGQTSSIHEDLPQSAGTLREHLSVPDAGHFDLFHGRLCREIIAPQLLAFFARASKSHTRRYPQFG
jgi:poly(3-hydroxybutyrate) depolymerase